jgi:glutaminyl-tRNA synthetase
MSEPETTPKGPDTETKEEATEGKVDFIRERIIEDLEQGKNQGRVHTRFPPEPNGYLHIGHSKSITLNFSVAQELGGKCNLRFDDTNPSKESTEYVESIKEDIRWLGFDWEDRELYASDYFDKLYDYAEHLVTAGKAYVDSLSAEEIREHRGTFTQPGKPSPYRDRSIEENLDLLRRMKAGEFPDGAHVLRAKIDMASPNLNLRDPTIYRIKHVSHHRTGDRWCIYPMYDFTHGQSDALEGITHSICTLEFEAHRPLYDWYLDNLPVPCHPQQIEFARLNLSFTVMSKRKLLRMVTEGLVSGWDDPRMPTLRGMRRRGYSSESIRAFCERIGVAKRDNFVDVSLLEYHVREHLNATSPRVMAVLKPLKVVIENFPEGEVEWFDAPYHPEDPSQGSRKVPFSRELYIERDDFLENPPRKFYRLSPGREVRLRYACLITCQSVVRDEATGEITEVRCTWDPDSKGGNAPDGRKVKVTMHWVSAQHALEAEVRLYDRLFTRENPEDVPEGQDFTDSLNADSLDVLEGCRLEPSLASAQSGDRFQFERLGYFCKDSDSAESVPVFNRTVTLRDTWAKIAKQMESQPKGSKK